MGHTIAIGGLHTALSVLSSMVKWVMMRWRGRTRWNRKMEARSDAPFSGEVEAGRMSNLYLSVGAEVGVQGLERGLRGQGACQRSWLEQVVPD